MADEVVAPEAEAKKEPTLKDILASLGGPDEVAIEQMKKNYGQVFVTPLSETEVFVWRPLRRQEFRELQKKLNDEKSGWDQLEYEEQLVKICLLWGSVRIDSAGTATTLAEQVMQRSNFMDPRQAASLIFQL